MLRQGVDNGYIFLWTHPKHSSPLIRFISSNRYSSPGAAGLIFRRLDQEGQTHEEVVVSLAGIHVEVHGLIGS